MRVQVTVEVDITDDCHPDHAARLVDSGLTRIAESMQVHSDRVGSEVSLRSWHIKKVQEVSPELLDTL